MGFAIFLLVLGLMSLIKPEWVAAVERHRRAFGTNLRPEEIEMSQTWHDLHVIAGAVMTAVGLWMVAARLL